MEVQKYVPTIQWYQNTTHLFIDILLPNVNRYTIDFETKETTTVFLFETQIDEKHYLVCFDLYKSVIDNQYIHKNVGRSIKIVCKKMEDDEDEDDGWSRLTLQKNYYKNQIRYNLEKMNIRDEMSEEEMKMMEQMKMMQMMGGGSYMNGGEMESLEEGEEDGEEEDGDEEDGEEEDGDEEEEENEEDGEDGEEEEEDSKMMDELIEREYEHFDKKRERRLAAMNK